jgi:zinc transporter ZupT
MLETDRPIALREAIMACRNGGTSRSSASTAASSTSSRWARSMNRSLTIKTGQCHVQRYMRPLLERIERGEIDPSFVITHRMPLDEAPAGLRDVQRQAGRVHFKPLREAEGAHTNLTRSALLVIAITLHNIPEGLAIGVSFGAAGLGMANATLGAAVALAIGIGLQNAPEGSAISLPLRGDGMSRFKAWWYGQLSAAVEPLAAVAGAAGVLMMRPVLPYALAFAAGAMIYVVVEEVIPESQSGGNADGATLASMVGFVIMMSLDVALG